MPELENLRPAIDNALQDLSAGEELWQRIQREAEKKPHFRPAKVWVAAAAAAVLLCLAGGGKIAWNAGNVKNAGIANEASVQSNRVTANAVNVRVSSGEEASAENLVLVDGKTYQLTGETASEKLLGSSLGTVNEYTRELSLSGGRIASGLLPVDTEIFAVKGASGLIAASMNGSYLVFQRTQVFGNDGARSLEETLCSTENVKSISYGGKLLSGSEAQAAMKTLYQKAEKLSEKLSGGSDVVMELQNGLHLYLEAKEDCLIGCGVWYCPEFFSCFQ